MIHAKFLKDSTTSPPDTHRWYLPSVLFASEFALSTIVTLLSLEGRGGTSVARGLFIRQSRSRVPCHIFVRVSFWVAQIDPTVSVVPFRQVDGPVVMPAREKCPQESGRLHPSGVALDKNGHWSKAVLRFVDEGSSYVKASMDGSRMSSSRLLSFLARLLLLQSILSTAQSIGNNKGESSSHHGSLRQSVVSRGGDGGGALIIRHGGSRADEFAQERKLQRGFWGPGGGSKGGNMGFASKGSKGLRSKGMGAGQMRSRNRGGVQWMRVPSVSKGRGGGGAFGTGGSVVVTGGGDMMAMMRMMRMMRMMTVMSPPNRGGGGGNTMSSMNNMMSNNNNRPTKGGSKSGTTDNNMMSGGGSKQGTVPPPTRRPTAYPTQQDSRTLEPTLVPTNPDSQTSEPTIDGQTAEPTTEGQTAEPTVMDSQTTEPTIEGQTAEPTVEGQTSEPTDEGQTAEPTLEGQTEEPTVDGQTDEPTVEGQTAEPTSEDQTEAPTIEGQTGETAEPTIDGQTAEPTVSSETSEPTAEGQTVEPTSDAQTAEPTADPTAAPIANDSGIRRRASPFNLVYEFSSDANPNDGDFEAAEDVVVEHLDIYFQAQFSANPFTSYERISVNSVVHTNDPTASSDFDITVVFAESSTDVPEVSDIDLMIETALDTPAKQDLITLLDGLVETPFTDTTDVTYSADASNPAPPFDTSQYAPLNKDKESRHYDVIIGESKSLPGVIQMDTTVCFRTTAELRTAVKDYVANPGEDTLLAKKYGWPIKNWCVSGLLDFSFVFAAAEGFNEPLDSWDVAQADTLRGMFYNATSFNQDLSSWRIDKVADMSSVFFGAAAFNGDISSWNTGKVVDASFMFAKATSFNGDISEWDMTNAERLQGTFEKATSFDCDISSWNLQSAQNLDCILRDATSFANSLCPWMEAVAGRDVKMANMFTGSGCEGEYASVTDPALSCFPCADVHR